MKYKNSLTFRFEDEKCYTDKKREVRGEDDNHNVTERVVNEKKTFPFLFLSNKLSSF